VRSAGPNEVRVYARTQTFRVGEQASLRDDDPAPSAIECLLGALGADLLQGFCVQAARQCLVLHEVEVSLSGRLNNVLVHLGVIGEQGHAGLESVTGTLYVSADADDEAVQAAWRDTLARAPVFATLSRSVQVAVELRMSP
jgi:hypothetical protein